MNPPIIIKGLRLLGGILAEFAWSCPLNRDTQTCP